MTMSYLPSSRLYEREVEPVNEPAPTVERKARTTVIAPAAEPVAAPAPAPVADVPVVTVPASPPHPKEWLVAPPPMLHVEAPKTESAKTETVTTPPSPPLEENRPGRKRNIFHKARRVVQRHIDRAKNGKPIEGDPDILGFAA